MFLDIYCLLNVSEKLVEMKKACFLWVSKMIPCF